MNTIYLKVTNEKENHYGFQYQDGLNILIEKFNDDPNASCVAGGFYFTTAEYIHNFYGYGVYLRVVILPIDDPEFRMVKDSGGDKYRANRIILGERYSLTDFNTYLKFGIKFPKLTSCCNPEYFPLLQYLVSNGADIHVFHDEPLRLAAGNGYLEIVKYVVEKGADINAMNSAAVITSAANGHLDVLKYLVERGGAYDKLNNMAICLAAANGHFDVVRYLVETDPKINKNVALTKAAKDNHMDIFHYLVEKGADIHTGNGVLFQIFSENGNLTMLKYLVRNGINVRTNISVSLKWADIYNHMEVVEYLQKLNNQLMERD